jgi:RecB family endonuclease NucS
MSYNRIDFAQFLADEGKKPGSVASYLTDLKRLDRGIGGIDEAIEDRGPAGIVDWLAENSDTDFGASASNVRSATNAYLRFRISAQSNLKALPNDSTPDENAATVFRYENELQAAVRLQLDALEPGLVVDDGGSEATFDTGRSDILARDRSGCAVVIELKAGKCPKGAIEQVLGYAQDLIAQGTEQRVRMIVVAGEFSARQKAAALRVPGLELKTYQLAVRFGDA